MPAGRGFVRGALTAGRLAHLTTLNPDGSPLRAFADVRIVVGPQTITRYNNVRAVSISGSPAPAPWSNG